MEFEQIRLRITSLVEDMKFVDELLAKKLGYETRMWAIEEQKTNPNFQDPDAQKVFVEQMQRMKFNIENTEDLLKKVRAKILRSMGRV